MKIVFDEEVDELVVRCEFHEVNVDVSLDCDGGLWVLGYDLVDGCLEVGDIFVPNGLSV